MAAQSVTAHQGVPSGSLRLRRAALLRSTALQAVALSVLAVPAAAQLAPSARPSGGQVTAGQASIGGNASATVITQSSQGAVINWQSYNVGSAQTVQYKQPDAGALTLNRVLSANPSEIAGRITANGQIIIVNQSGVVFDRGSQVNTAGLVVSSAGISNKNFMAGKMVFNQAGRAGASVSNAGTITVRQAGLAALVAPQVANSGVITAQLGHVVLAGGTAATLDMYGDRLVSLNVTRAVRAVDVGGQAVPALVTNSGTLLAPGGTVVLTARDADAVVTNLVESSGTIAADTMGRRRGTVVVSGVGGSVEIDGSVSATGTAPGSVGGRIAIDASNTVTLAANAMVDASGAAGGGVVGVGTTLHRARHGYGVPKNAAQNVLIAQGAVVRADATASGNGGHIAVLSNATTDQAGALSARGAGASGRGGEIEVSGSGVLTITGIENAGAAAGAAAGIVLIDPAFVEITSGTPDPGYTAITPTALDNMTGNVEVKAGNTLKLLSNVALGVNATSFELLAGTLMVLSADWNADTLSGTFKSGSGGIMQTAGTVTAGALDLISGGAVVQNGGALDVGTLNGRVGSGTLTQQSNKVGTLGSLTTSGSFALTTGTALTVGQVQSSGNLILQGPSIAIDGLVTAGLLDLIATGGDITEGSSGVINVGALTGSAKAGGGLTGQASLTSLTNTVGVLDAFTTAGDFSLVDASPLSVMGALSSTNGGVSITIDGGSNALTLANDISAPTTISLISAGTGGITQTAGTISANTLSVMVGGAFDQSGGVLNVSTLQGSVGSAMLTDSNMVGTLAPLTTSGAFALTTGGMLTVGQLAGGSNSLTLTGSSITLTNTVTTGLLDLIATGGNIVEQNAGAINAGTLIGSAMQGNGLSGQAMLNASGNTIAALGKFTTTGAFSLVDTKPNLLTVTDAVQAGSTLSLSAQSLTIAGNITSELATGGTIFLQANTFDLAASVTARNGGLVAFDRLTPGTLNLASSGGDFSGLDNVTAGRLDIGTFKDPTLTFNTAPTDGHVDGITITQALNLTNVATLGLFVKGVGSGISDTAALDVGTLFGAAGGAASFTSTQTQIGVLGSFITGSGFAFNDLSSLTLADAATIAGGTGTISLAVAGMTRPTLALGVKSGATLTADGAITLTADGDVTQNGGAVVSAGGSVSVSSNDADVVLNGGDVMSVLSNVTINAADRISQTDGTVSAAGTAFLMAGGPAGFSQAGGTVQGASLVVVDATSGAISALGTIQSSSGSAVFDAAVGDIDIGGLVKANTSLLLAAGGNIAETSSGNIIGQIEAGTLSAAAGTGSISLNGRSNAIGTIAALSDVALTLSLTGMTAGAGISLVDSQPLTLENAAVTAGNAQGNDIVIALLGTNNTVLGPLTQIGGSITADGGGVTLHTSSFVQDGAVLNAAGAVQVMDGGLAQTGSSITAGSVGVTDSAIQTNSSISAATNVSVGGGLMQTLSTIKGDSVVVGGDVMQGTSSITGTNGVTLNGSLTQTASTVGAPGGNVMIADSLMQTDGTVSASGFVIIPQATGGTVTQIGNSVIDGTAGVTLGLAGALTQDGGTIITQNGMMVINAAGGIDFGGVLQAGTFGPNGYTGTILLTSGGVVSEMAGNASGEILAGVLSVSAAGAILLDPAAQTNQIGTITTLTATSGDIELGDTVSLIVADGAKVDATTGALLVQVNDQTGATTALTIGTSAGATLMAANGITLTADGGIAQNGGAITASGGGVLIMAGNLGSGFGGFTQTNGAIDAQAGAASVTAQQDITQNASALSGAGGVSLTAAGGSLVQTASAISSSVGGVSITAAGSLSQTGGSAITAAGDISVNTGAGLTQTMSAIQAAGLTTVIAGGGISQDASTLSGAYGLSVTAGQGITSQGGTFASAGVTGMAGSGNVSLDAMNGSIAFDGLIASGGTMAGGIFTPAGASTVTLLASGNIGEADGGAMSGQILAGALGAEAGGAIQLNNAATTQGLGNQIASINAQTGLLAKGGDIDLIDGVSLAVLAGAAVNAQVASVNFAVGQTGGAALDLSVASGATVQAQTAINLDATGTINLSGRVSTPGVVSLGGPAGSAASAISAPGQIDAVTIAAEANGAVDLSGANLIGAIGTTGLLTGLSGASVTLVDDENLAIDANVRASSGAISIAGLQSVTETSGVTMKAATLLGIAAPQTISLGGTLTAPRIVLGEATTQSVMWNNSTVSTDSGLPSGVGADDVPQPLTGNQPGVFVEAENFAQTGTTHVSALAGQQATMQVTITGTGTASFANLLAPTTQLLLDLRAGGNATGKIDVAGLNIFTDGLTPKTPTKLTGQVGIFYGTAAAGAGFAHVQNINYQLNGCAVESLSCVLLSPIAVPIVDPVTDFYVDTSQRRHDEDDALPNVADVDY